MDISCRCIWKERSKFRNFRENLKCTPFFQLYFLCWFTVIKRSQSNYWFSIRKLLPKLQNKCYFAALRFSSVFEIGIDFRSRDIPLPHGLIFFNTAPSRGIPDVGAEPRQAERRGRTSVSAQRRFRPNLRVPIAGYISDPAIFRNLSRVIPYI